MKDYYKLVAAPALLAPYVVKSLQIKKEMIERDEFDQGPRRVFNYGHTFGHALEGATDHALAHGNAVTAGMDVANYLAMKLGMITSQEYEKFFSLIDLNMPTYILSDSMVASYFNLLFKDKKNIGNSLVCVLPHGIDDIRLITLHDKSKIMEHIQEYFAFRGCV